MFANTLFSLMCIHVFMYMRDICVPLKGKTQKGANHLPVRRVHNNYSSVSCLHSLYSLEITRIKLYQFRIIGNLTHTVFAVASMHASKQAHNHI